MNPFEHWPNDKTVRGQAYVCIGIEPHEKRDGGRTLLARWQSTCAECGEPFSFTMPLLAARFEPNRRCTKHKRPGQRVTA